MLKILAIFFFTIYPLNLLASEKLPLVPGNILVANDPVGVALIMEYTPQGEFVDQMNLGSEMPRDLVLINQRYIAAFNGAFPAELLVVDPIYGGTKKLNFTGWTTANNLTYGGLANFANYVFATDMSTFGDGAPRGLIRFDMHNGNGQRFGALDNIDVAVGHDGLVYALAREGIAAHGTIISVYDPESLSLLRRFRIRSARGLAIDANGEIFAAVREPESVLAHYDSSGTFIKKIKSPIAGLCDIDIDSHGMIVAASHGGEVVVTDQNFHQIKSFPTRSSDNTNFTTIIE